MNIFHFLKRAKSMWLYVIAWIVYSRVVVNKYTYAGLENVPDGPVIFVGNHLDDMDPYRISAAVPLHHLIRWVASEKLTNAEAWQTYEVQHRGLTFASERARRKDLRKRHVKLWFVRYTGSIVIGEGSASNRAVHVLESGYSLGIFPQGTKVSLEYFARSKVHKSFGFFAQAANVPIVPVTITPLEDGGYSFSFHEPIVVAGDSRKDAVKAANAVWSTITESLDGNMSNSAVPDLEAV